MSKPKVITGYTPVTTFNDDNYAILVDKNGGILPISKASLRSTILGGFDLNDIYDNVFIMYHRKSDDFPLMVKPQYWPSIQNGGEVAEGVVVVEGGHVLVVAPTESTSGLLWSSADITTGNPLITDRLVAMNDWDGKANTAKIIAASSDQSVTNTAQYAAGFCNLYSRTNANGKGLTAGRWWLPSVAEWMMVYANMMKINHCLSLINGATQLVKDWYWLSTEGNASNAWGLHLNDSNLNYWGNKSQFKRHVRPVSAFLQ